ncbi:ABC transporter substrate-binding protein [Candidatus Bathyarchaeota archaeon]|mgnify:FL=1|nr:MAG: ABC transporter substrate-binding protein [Candidatus Bathyarchaeota archaeon]
MDKRIIVGIIGVLIVVGGLYVFVFNNPTTPPGDGVDDGDGTDQPTPQATIEGVITDEAGDPVSGATVELDGETVTTGSDGSYSFTVDVGSYTLTVSKDGYKDETSTVSATSEDTYTVDLAIMQTENGDDNEPDVVEIKIITRHGSDILFKARAAFLETDIAAEYGITDREQIKFLGVASSLWADTITRSGDVDVAWGGGPVVFDLVNNDDLLAPLTSDAITSILNELPDEISGAPAKRYKEGEVVWVGSAISSFGFTINTEFLATEELVQPKTWDDLGNETYAQFALFPSVPVIGTADPTLSTSNTRMFEIILQTYGWEEGWKLLTRIGANARIYDRSESVRDAAIQGTIGAGTTIDFYGYTAQLEVPELCEYVLPEDGTAVNADPIALVSTSDNPEAAQAFIAWVLSPDGQKIWLDESINRMPMNPAVFDTDLGQTRDDLEASYSATMEATTIEFSDSLALSYETTMMFFFKGTLVEAQQDLIDTWITIVDAESNGDITHEEFLELADMMGDPLEITFTDPDSGDTVMFTEEYAQSINDRITTDAVFKETMKNAWREAAIARYASVLDALDSYTG